MQPDANIAGSLTKLASDYGPFLFAILFAVIIPFRAYQSYCDSIAKYPQPSEKESELIAQSELYFRSAWIAGFVLIAFSVGWWFYFNWDRLHTAHKGYLLSYDGEITGVTPDDKLGGGDYSPVLLTFNNSPPRYVFHILTQTPISTPTPFRLLWVSDRQTAGHESGYDGTKWVSLRYDPATKEYQFKRSGDAPTIQAVSGN